MKTTFYIFISTICLLLSACSNDPILGDDGFLGLIDIRFNVTDTVTNADSHSFLISMVSWDKVKKYPWHLYKYTGDTLPDSTINNHPHESGYYIDCPKNELSIMGDSIIGNEWITFKRISNDSVPQIKVSIKPNDTDSIRGVMLCFDDTSNKHYFYQGHIFIFQRPMPDPTPFRD